MFEDSVGGVTAYQTNFARQLLKRDYKVSVMIPRTKSHLPEKTVTPEGVTIYRYGSARETFFHILDQLISAKKMFNRVFADYPIDMINVHFALSTWGVLHLPKTKYIPKIMHYHGPWPLEWMEEKRSENKKPSLYSRFINQVQRRIEKNVVEKMDEIILVSHAFFTYLKNDYGVTEEKMHVIPIGWDTECLKPVESSKAESRKKLGILPHKKVLVAVRRLVKRTGIDLLIEAAAPLFDEFPDFEIYVAGKGSEAENLKKLAEKLGIEKQVHFLGFVPDEKLALYYRASDLSCVPSRSLEGFGTIVLESLIQGTPAIATPVGGLSEILNPFAPQLLTEDVSVYALGKKIRSWLSNDLMIPDEQSCRNYVTQFFNWERLFPMIETIFTKYGI